ncbi:hypothetical protein FACS1894200_09600 [Spirochaetia bacterium]|nr:hypothetical protein FACS1894200_09600 [Spirochaetia bacterium]
MLHVALKQGLYKAYRRVEHNDTNVKGVVDIKRHIRCNIPFAGKIAYNTGEYNFDNPVTELIRHTIECIKTHRFGSGLLMGNADTIVEVNQIVSATPSYSRNERQKIMNANSNPLNHPYFTEYKMLQKICLCILRHDKLTYGKEKDKVHGLLFDGAWLWEEYLNTLLKDEFVHMENKTGKNKHFLFANNTQPIFPDFISKDGMIIADAKYKHLEYSNGEYGRNDYYQLITYMYRFNSLKGYLLFPHSGNINSIENTIKDTDGVITKLGLAIPQNGADGQFSFNDFKRNMKSAEDSFHTELSAE